MRAATAAAPVLLMLLGGCGSTAAAPVGEGLDCAGDERVGWAIDRDSGADGAAADPVEAVRADVPVTPDQRLVPGEARIRDDVTTVEVRVEHDGGVVAVVEVRSRDGGWFADNVSACPEAFS